MRTLSLGISPCPNDTFIFHALIAGLVPFDHSLELHMRDVEELNRTAARGALDVSKLSLGALPFVLDEYVLLRAGAALGFGVGPLLVAGEPLTVEDCRDLSVAVPGRFTTANLLLELHGGFNGPRREMVFDQIMPAVMEGRCPCGLLIHEGRFTYVEKGLYKVLDLGEWWEGAFSMPLPLGVIAAKRSLGAERIAAFEDALRASLRHARAQPEAGRDFIRRHAQELDDAVTDAHIRTFVTEFSLNLGPEGERAIRVLAEKACALAGKNLPNTLFPA